MSVSKPLTVQVGAGQALVSAGAGRIVFTSVIETSGAAVVSFALFDGNPASARGILDYSLGASGSTREAWPEHGVPFEGDLWIGSTSGQGTARIHVVPEDLWHRWKRDYWLGLESAMLGQEVG